MLNCRFELSILEFFAGNELTTSGQSRALRARVGRTNYLSGEFYIVSDIKWKSAHLSSAGKKSSLTMMRRNRKRRRTKRTEAKGMHSAGRAYDTGHCRSKATSKWQWSRITLHAGFTKISMSRQNKFERCWQQRGRRAERTNVKYNWQVSSRGGNTGWAQILGGYGF